MRAVINAFLFISGLVISVKDNLTLQMKLMYKKNKIQSEKICKLKAEREQHQVCILTYYFCSQFVKIHGGIGLGIGVPSGKSQVGTLQMGLVAKKPVFGGLRTTKVQTSLRIRAV